MKSEIYDDMALEQNALRQFGFRCDIKQVIVRNIPVSRTLHATVFLTKKKELMAYIDGQSNMTLGDVRKVIARMGLVAELFLPPKDHPNYFHEIAKEKFLSAYPGRRNPSEGDLLYYKTLAAYKPALVQIQAIKNGEIYAYDPDSHTKWRACAQFAYRRIKTS